MTESQIASNRLGLGARPGEAVVEDPSDWLERQISGWKPALTAYCGAISDPFSPILATRADLVTSLASYRGPAKRKGGPADPKNPASIEQEKADRMAARKAAVQFARSQDTLQIGLRVGSAIATDMPFAERLVHFWANHFAVSTDRPEVLGLAGLMEFEAIRPHIFSRFEDMLIAVEQHPAMLLYLDQVQSIGPASQVGQRAAQRGRRAGLNENLGREIMELHTLGVRTGYTQADVTQFAAALTGWSVAGLEPGLHGKEIGDFGFSAARHEPGVRKIMGRTYPEGGEDQALAVLANLARSPATARHLATKLARHFVADDPPPGLVAQLEHAYLASDGHLPTVYQALVAAPETWAPGASKFRTPWQWTIAALRALDNPHGRCTSDGGGFPLADHALSALLVQLGQPVWRPGSPAGYDDIAASWAAPDALLRRVEAAGRLAAKAPPSFDARQAAGQIFGSELSQSTELAIGRAESPRQGLSLLLVCPEMMKA